MINTYIGFAKNDEIRQKGSSGGIGSSVIKYLFQEDIIQSAISFTYDPKVLQYHPEIIYSFSDYRIVGSIYHKIDLINFIKENIGKIKGNFACFALPCQVHAIRSLIERTGHQCYIIGLVCSSQQSIEATYYLLKRIKIKPNEVVHLQYRGNGWPSGIQITKNNGERKLISNGHSIWTTIFHSRLFISKQCFNCRDTLNKKSDIALADPWLREYSETETIGKTFIISNTVKGEKILKEISEKVEYIYLEEVPKEKIINSQKSTICRKEKYAMHKKIMRILISIWQSRTYKRIVLQNNILFKIHCKIKNSIEYRL